jgi:CRISPR-associated protein Cas2
MFHVLAYDISDPGRLARVAKIMEDYGKRVQLSIFEVDADQKTMRTLRDRVGQAIDHDVDGVKVFPLCESCLKKTLVMGIGGLDHAAEPYVIL